MDRFTQAIYDFKKKCPEHPTRMYLGEEEWQELRFLAQKANFVYTENSGAEFNGLKIYLVKEKSHFNIA